MLKHYMEQFFPHQECNKVQLLHTCSITLYPGLLTPVFVTCSINAGEGLVKLSDVQRCTLTCGGVAHSSLQL